MSAASPAPNSSGAATAIVAADIALMQRVAQADQSALGELYDRYHGVLFGLAVNILRDGAEAEDIVHDVFVAVWKKAAEFDSSRGAPFSWIATLVRNRSIDRIRMRRRRGELLDQAAPTDLPHQVEGEQTDAAAEAEANEQALDVRRAVDTLPEEQREALMLAFFSGLTQSEIAGRLHAPLGTVKARIRRGLLRLKDLVGVRP